MQKKKKKKKWQKISCFWDNCIWNGCCKLSLLRREYLWLPVNALRNKFKTFDSSKGDFLQRNCLHSDQKLLMVAFSIFEQCFLPFTRPLLKVSCEDGLFLMTYQTVLRLCISVREMFSEPIAFRGINKYAKRAAIQISRVLVPADHAGCQSVLSNRFFWDIYLNTFFGVRNFGNKSAMRLFFFWKMFKI